MKSLVIYMALIILVVVGLNMFGPDFRAVKNDLRLIENRTLEFEKALKL